MFMEGSLSEKKNFWFWKEGKADKDVGGRIGVGARHIQLMDSLSKLVTIGD